MSEGKGGVKKGQASPEEDKDRELGGEGQVEAVELPIDGVLDLHTFRPGEVKELINDYLEECLKRGIYDLRIIHGKGTGTLKAIVHSILKKHPAVLHFQDADPLAGGWGATEVTLRRK
ncbi:MAG: Smr/MutS family protein [Candidatus Saccharicenans sp.]|uniref:Smr/MutS family protein n=1 Tax=Candidatus Saccharicenans sp. TaxID=2819258 RepID=UPI004048FCF2